MSAGLDSATLARIAAEFDLPGRPLAAEPLSGGHINESYRVTFATQSGSASALLQRLNTSVFTRPDHVMENVARVCDHLRSGVTPGPGTGSREAAEAQGRSRPDIAASAPTGVIVPALIRTRDGRTHFRTIDGGVWRAFEFVENTYTRLTAETPDQARRAAAAFGRFQKQLSDLSGPRLRETIPRFHCTPSRYEAFEAAVARDAVGRVREVAAEIDLARRHAGLAHALTDLHESGAVPERIVHNDAKISNVLFCKATHQARCVVDLDTVMPGLSLFDFGDMVRSMASRAAEDEPDPAKVVIDRDLLAAVATGYLAEAGEFLTELEQAHLVTAGQVITYEQGLRFLTDYLEGDRYYRTARPAQNLDRARRHFRVLELLIRDEAALRRLCDSSTI